jgi:hypothetical protein
MSDAGFAAFLDAARLGREELARAHPNLDALERDDFERYLAALCEGALQFVHADPARPVFAPWTTPDRRWADNGRDSAYWMAPVDGHRRYVIRGCRGDECYLSFSVYAGDPGAPERIARNVNHLELGAGRGEAFELEIEPPSDACYVIARQYFLAPERETPAQIAIEARGAAAAPRGSQASRWSAACSFLRAMTSPRAGGSGALPGYVSRTPNVMGDPSAWTEAGTGGRGTPDQTYAMGPFALEADQALVLDLRFPACCYSSAALWNRFSQSIDARFHRSTLNHTQLRARSVGRARIVVAPSDPGVANWLDTGGRKRGSVFWRFLLAREPVAPIASRVVPVAEVASLP